MSQPLTSTRIKVNLSDVPETLLWNLYLRASEARRPDTVLRDPIAVDLLRSLDYPFEQRFGRVTALQAQAQALRVKTFDLEVERFLERYPDATVVALGEGLETQAWRVDNGQVRWLTVELPETAQLRRSLLPASPRRRVLVGSAFDDAWMDQVDQTHAVMVTAQGLLMYFQPDDVHELIERCGARFPGATLLFDAMPRWFSRRTLSGLMVNEGFRPPPMPWGIDEAELERLRRLRNVESLVELPLPRGRGFLFSRVVPLLRSAPIAGASSLTMLAPWRIFRLRFGTGHIALHGLRGDRTLSVPPKA
jgi:O-methyltransferase involved in polyketide biosynthesis